MPDRRLVCPAPSQLEAYRSSELPTEEARLVAEHLEDCEACRTELEELDLDEAFLGDLRDHVSRTPISSQAALPDEPSSDPEYEALVAHLLKSGEGERYEVLGELGHGGMGVVFDVRDRVLQRDLAMKVVRLDNKSPSGGSPAGRRLARFLDEARITGQLDHPSIISVHELGIDSEGRAFFTMSKVRGRDLHDVLEEFERGDSDWTFRRLIAILLRACEALAYAHSKHFVHRDLKPANIMVGSFGEVYVIDWGVAKKRGERDSSDLSASDGAQDPLDLDGSPVPSLTLDGEIIGTPAYMAPEQALGKTDRVDLRADVYSMGAILYRLLSGQRPYGGVGEWGSQRDVWRRLLDGSPASLEDIAPESSPELVAICQRAMARDPAARYPNMELLVGDLRAWLDGRVVSAHKTGAIAEVRKWIGRNRALAGLGAVAGLVVLGMFWSQTIVAARAQAVDAHVEKTMAADRLKERDPTEALRLAIEVAETEEDYRSRTTLLAALNPHSREADLLTGETLRSDSNNWFPEGVHRSWSADGNFFVFGGGISAGFRAIRVWDVKARRLTTDSFPASAHPHLIFDPTGNLIAHADPNGELTVHDRRTGESREFAQANSRGQGINFSRLVFDPQGERLAGASLDHSIGLWNAATGKRERTLLGHEGVVIPIVFDASGERLLSGSGTPLTGFESDHTARVWDVESGECLTVFDGHSGPLNSVNFSVDGQSALSTSMDGTAVLWDTETGAVKRTMSFTDKALDGAFSPNGRQLAVAYDSGILVLDMESGLEQRIGRYDAHNGRAVSDVEFSPQGDRLLSIGYDGIGRVWKVDGEGPPELDYALRDSEPKRAYGSWSPDGNVIALHGRDGTSLWFTHGNQVTSWVRPAASEVLRARFHPAGDRILLAFLDRPAFECVFEPGKRLQPLGQGRLGDAVAVDVTATADGTWTLVAEKGGPVRLWRRILDGESLESGSVEVDAVSLHPSRTDAIVGAIMVAGGAATMDLSKTPVALVRYAEGETVTAMDLSKDGRRVLLGTADSRLHLYDRESGERLSGRTLQKPSSGARVVHSVSFYDQDRRFLNCGPRGGVWFWEAGSSEFSRVELSRLPDALKDTDTVGSARILKSGLLLLRNMWTPGLRLVDGTDRRTLDYLHPPGQKWAHRGNITSWSLEPSERRLLTTSLDKTATIWDLESREPWVSFTAHSTSVTAGDLTRDGRWAVTGDAHGYVRVWPTDPLPWAKRAQPDPGEIEPC